MSIQKFSVSRDTKLYEAWPDVAQTASGKLLCVFCECIHHSDRSYARIMIAESSDRGRVWSPKRPVFDATLPETPFYYNCPRIVRLNDQSLMIAVDRVAKCGEESSGSGICLSRSFDEGKRWTPLEETPVAGIVPDKPLQLPSGRILLSAHYKVDGKLAQFLRYSDDNGKSWSREITVARSSEFNLCEVSLLPMGNHTIVALMRENSGLGYDCKKAVSRDDGETWGPIIDFPLPGCHRPVSGHLSDGSVLITYRFMQGGKGWLGFWTQNFFAALTDDESILAESRSGSCARILPVDYDRSPKSDLGYSGWVEFPDGEIYVVNYIVDDAVDKGQIRGYSLRKNDFFLS